MRASSSTILRRGPTSSRLPTSSGVHRGIIFCTCRRYIPITIASSTRGPMRQPGSNFFNFFNGEEWDDREDEDVAAPGAPRGLPWSARLRDYFDDRVVRGRASPV